MSNWNNSFRNGTHGTTSFRDPRYMHYNYGSQPTRRYAWEENSQNVPSFQHHQHSPAVVPRSDQVNLGLYNQPTTTDQSDPVKLGLYNQPNTRDQSDQGRLGLYNETNTSGQNRMETDESSGSSGAVMTLKKTEDLFTTLQSLSSLVSESKREIKALEQTASAKSSVSSADLNERMEKLILENQRLETLSKNSADVDKLVEDAVNKEKVKQEAYRKKFEALVHQYEKEHKMVEELQETVKQHKHDIDKLSNEKDSVDRLLARKHELYVKESEEKKKVELELSECKTRLSRYMGSKLSNNNPDLADLSDKNRPTKLAEMYQELYDNEWTNAYEVFEKAFNDERKTIDTLLQVLKDVKRRCDRLTKDQEQKLRESVFLKRTRDSNLPDHVSKQVKDFRKAIAETTLPEVLEQCLDDVKIKEYAKFLADGEVQSFFKKCVEICWLMLVQDPVVVFGEEPERLAVFDTNIFKHYTRTGPYFEYMVWPAIYLHEGGPLLGKGIAQGYGEQPRQMSKGRSKANRQVQGEPEGQIIDRNTARKENVETITYQEHQGATDVSSEQNKYSQYQQQPNVTETNNFDNTRCLSRTTREHSSTSVADRFNRLGSSQRDGSYHRPKYPGYILMQEFENLIRLYGEGNPVVKKHLGEKYDMCKDYYDYLYKK